MERPSIRKVVALASILLLPGCAKDDEGISRKERAELIALTKEYVAVHLIDPESARFRGVKVYEPQLIGPIVVCGEVNSKNRFGGYAGYKRFIFNGPQRHTVVFDPSASDYRGWCTARAQSEREYAVEREEERAQAENMVALVDWFNRNYSIEVRNLYLVELANRGGYRFKSPVEYGFIGELVISCASAMRCEQLRGYTATLYIDVLAGSENVNLQVGLDSNQGTVEETIQKGCLKEHVKKHANEADEDGLAIAAFLKERGLASEKPDARRCDYYPSTQVKGVYRLKEEDVKVVLGIHPFFRADELRGELSEILDSANTASGGADISSLKEGKPQELRLRVRFDRGDIPISFTWTD